MKISGINGSNYILPSIAKIRVEAGFIEGAVIAKYMASYRVKFTGENAQWNGENLVLSSASQPSEAHEFKTIEDAMSAIEEIGINPANVVNKPNA